MWDTVGMDEDVNPFEGLPDELRAMLEQFGGGVSSFLPQLQSMLFGGGATGPVNWDLARRVSMQLAAEGDRDPTDAERDRAEEALRLAEHWLDEGSLPAPPDGGRLIVARRTEWVDAALTSMRPLVEPVAAASARAMGELAQEQMGDASALPPGLADLFQGLDLAAMMRPLGATMAGIQVGQVVGQLAGQLLGQYDLGVPTAPRATAMAIAVNVDEVFSGWELDPLEVAVTLALHEAAHRRLFHAVPWLEAHLHGLVAAFANGTRVDPEQLRRLADDLMTGIDPEDPDDLRSAMERAAAFRMQPTPEQARVLDRIQGVVCLTQAWARHEVARAAAGRLSGLPRIDEILRRRRATKGDGEALLEQLLGLDLKPDDETVGDAFVAAVADAGGTAGLREALAHPENLPDRDELADPSRWLVRMAAADAIPDDAASLFEGLGDAPVEESADERAARHDDDESGT